MKNPFEHLIEKKLDYDNEDIQVNEVIVSEIVYSKGITIEYVDDNSGTRPYAVCLNINDMPPYSTYEDEFLFLINCIEAGLIVRSEAPQHKNRPYNIVTQMAKCAFKIK